MRAKKTASTQPLSFSVDNGECCPRCSRWVATCSALASLALAARDFAPLGENLLRIGIELVEGEAGAALEPSRMTRWQGRGGAFAN